jgi:HTH-type transcriptional regulator/antitoxin HigA
MDIRPLHTEDDYRAALAEVSALVDLDPEPGTPDGDRLEILSTLVERYETAHFPFGATLREAFQRMEKISPEIGDRFKVDIREGRTDGVLRHLKGNAQWTDDESMQDAIARAGKTTEDAMLRDDGTEDYQRLVDETDIAQVLTWYQRLADLHPDLLTDEDHATFQELAG